MSVSIKGKQVSWGIPAGAKSAANALVEGIVESFEVGTGGEMEKIKDEDGDVVTRIDYGEENTISINIVVTDPFPVLPAKRTEITGLGVIDGVDFSVGRTFVDDAKMSRGGTSAAKVTISASHNPTILADS